MRRSIYVKHYYRHTYTVAEAIDVEVDIYYCDYHGNANDPEDPPDFNAWVESIKHKGREISLDVIARLESIWRGCHVTPEMAEEFIIDDFGNTMEARYEML